MRVYIGTSGWVYKSWDKTFYPADAPKSHQFQFYVTQFPTVEINATFYRLPTLHMTRGWRDKAPPGFVYAVKGSRFITHMKQLVNLGGGLTRFFKRLKPMQARIGVVLWQLPPRMEMDLERLENFLKKLPEDYHHAVEFRHRSWMDKSTFTLLRRYKAAHASVSSLRMPMDLTVTSRLVYIRFHGLENGAAHDYTRQELEPWAEHVRHQSAQGKKVFAYFNNDANVRAPANARLFMEMTGALREEPAYAEAA